MNIYIVHENYDGRIYEIFTDKSRAEATLESLDKHGIDYYVREYETVD